MIVRRSEFDTVVNLLSKPGEYGLDTETTGLKIYQGDRLFSIIISDEKTAYYFNFQEYTDLNPEWILPRYWLIKLKPIFEEPQSTWFLSNAKYDMGVLSQEGLFLEGTVHCTEALGRVERNDRIKYGLDSLAQLIGLKKDDTVKAYIVKNGHWALETIPGKKKRNKLLFYDRAPFDLIVPYAEKDAAIVRQIGRSQTQTFESFDKATPLGMPSILNVVENEKRFTKTCFKMEQVGIQIDRKYCEKAIEYEDNRLREVSQEFQKLTGWPLDNKERTLSNIFRAAGETIVLTPKLHAKFDDETLRTYKSPAAALVRQYRDAYKKLNTYYRNFLHFADANGVVHPNIKQGGATTGRISITDPALQTLPDEEEEIDAPFKVRCAFVPRPGFFFFMPDYNQMEYRMMLDYSRQMDVIHQVKSGMDVHDATVDVISTMIGIKITRSQAKTLNFGLLYGMGIQALSVALHTTIEKATELKRAYFQALPFVKGFIRRATDRAETFGYVFNWFGRRYSFEKREFAYKAPNCLIQGGCSDAVKKAMNDLDVFLTGRKSRMIVQVHDEIGFEIHESESAICPEIVGIMERAYPHRHLPLTCSPEYSFSSWGDKVKGYV
jgi:DNA polymerase-1